MQACAVEIDLHNYMVAQERQSRLDDEDEALLAEIHEGLIERRLSSYSKNSDKCAEDFGAEILTFLDEEPETLDRKKAVEAYKQCLVLAAKSAIAHPNEKPAINAQIGECLSSLIHSVAEFATADKAEAKLQEAIKELEEEAAYERSMGDAL